MCDIISYKDRFLEEPWKEINNFINFVINSEFQCRNF